MPATTSNKYYDNIDQEILRTEYEGTIVFEDDSSAPAAVFTDNHNDITIKDLLGEYAYGILLELPSDDDTRESICGCLMEALPLQDVVDVDGAELCDSLSEFLDIDKQQQQRDIPTDTPPIESPLTKTKIRPNMTKTHT